MESSASSAVAEKPELPRHVATTYVFVTSCQASALRLVRKDQVDEYG
jgi:hypothetical protein